MTDDRHLTVSVILPTFDRPGMVKNRIEELLHQDRVPDEIVIVSQDPDPPRFDAFRRVKVVHMPTLGPAAARNRGAERADGDVLLFLEDDVQPQRSDFIRRHVDWYDHAFVSAVHGAVQQAGKPLPPVPPLSEDAVAYDWLTTSPNCERLQATVALAGGNLSIRRDVFEQLGGFDERFARGEDKDLGIRLFRAGAIVLHDPEARVTHLRAEGGTRGLGSPSRMAGLFRPQPNPGMYLLVLKHFARAEARFWFRRQLRSIWRRRNLLRPDRCVVHSIRLLRCCAAARQLQRSPIRQTST